MSALQFGLGVEPKYDLLTSHHLMLDLELAQRLDL